MTRYIIVLLIGIIAFQFWQIHTLSQYLGTQTGLILVPVVK